MQIAMEARLYLDNNATTPLRPEARVAMEAALSVFGNASSLHREGQQARGLVEDARRALANLIGVRAETLVMTSGGTESNVMALRGVMMEKPQGRLLVSSIEHESVLNTALAMKAEGRDVGIIPATADGVVDVTALEQELKKGNVALVSIMAANNETGVIQPIEEIVPLCRHHGALIHTDAVQAVGHQPVNAIRWDVDLLTFTAHKFGGPKGAGALYIKPNTPMRALLTGGAQERNRRAGTENVLAIVGAGAAAAAINLDADIKLWHDCRTTLETGLKKIANDLRIIGENASRLPHTTCFVWPGINAEDAVIALDMAGIAVSRGSACSAGISRPSHVLQAMGYDDDLANSMLRVSFGWASRPSEAMEFTDCLRQIMVK